jgi:hypothetical protein
MKTATMIQCFLFLLFATAALPKQKHKLPREAPLPDQIVQAKTVFLLSKTESLFYDEAYKQLRDWGRFQLVTDPEKADLIFVLTTEKTYLGSTVPSGDYGGVSRARYGQDLRLVIIDPKTSQELWSEERARRLARREKNRQKDKDAGS